MDSAKWIFEDIRKWNCFYNVAEPGRTLTHLVQRAAARPGLRVIASLPHALRGEDAQAALSAALARLWCAGAPVDWNACRGEEHHRRVSLPVYPFQRKRYWIERVDLRALLSGRSGSS